MQKTVHIVFQVLNFLHDVDSKKYKLLPIDKLILITLASHKGSKGIFPSQETLADELGMTIRHLRNRIKFLEKSGLLFVEKLGRRHFYHLTNLSTIEEPQFPYQEKIEELQFRSQGNYSSGHRGTTVPPNNKISNKLNKTERARKKRLPLSLDFHPNKNGQKMCEEVSAKTGLSFDALLTKFKNLQKSKDNLSADWDAEWENFLINERPSALLGEKKRSGQHEVKSTVPWFVPKERKPKVEVIPDDSNMPTPREVLAMMRADVEKRKALNGSKQHGELTNADLSRNRNGGESSKEN